MPVAAAVEAEIRLKMRAIDRSFVAPMMNNEGCKVIVEKSERGDQHGQHGDEVKFEPSLAIANAEPLETPSGAMLAVFVPSLSINLSPVAVSGYAAVVLLPKLMSSNVSVAAAGRIITRLLSIQAASVCRLLICGAVAPVTMARGCEARRIDDVPTIILVRLC